MTFTELLARVGTKKSQQIRCDSRKVQSGDIFVAIRGTQVDGHDFIQQAVDNGCGIVVAQDPVSFKGGAELIVVQDSSEALGKLAQAYYGNPNSQLTNLAVTGTNGKTTVAYLVRAILQNAGHQCGLIGTIQYDSVGEVSSAPLTTPDALSIADISRQIVNHGGKFFITEASSHALDQNRLAGVSFSAAAFTNLTGDHLDYHKSEEEYLAAKCRLFSSLPVHGLAVLNADSEASHKIASRINRRILWYSVKGPYDR